MLPFTVMLRVWCNTNGHLICNFTYICRRNTLYYTCWSKWSMCNSPKWLPSISRILHYRHDIDDRYLSGWSDAVVIAEFHASIEFATSDMTSGNGGKRQNNCDFPQQSASERQIVLYSKCHLSAESHAAWPLSWRSAQVGYGERSEWQ
jgi:hypothetical protein